MFQHFNKFKLFHLKFVWQAIEDTVISYIAYPGLHTLNTRLQNGDVTSLSTRLYHSIVHMIQLSYSLQCPPFLPLLCLLITLRSVPRPLRSEAYLGPACLASQ